MRGDVQCPMCPEVVRSAYSPLGVLKCECGWVSTWKAFRKTYKKQRLVADGMMPYLEAFAVSYPKARGYKEKMILIDQLIHQFHGEMGMTGGRKPGAANLIEGKVEEVMELLNSITYSTSSTPGMAAVRDAWVDRQKPS